MSEQTQAERLAGVLKRHGDWRYGNGSFIRCDCGEHVGFPDDDAPGKGSRAHATHLAAAVLAHLEAQGWAQGREEWGLDWGDGEYYPEPDKATALEWLASENASERLIRRRVTPWEPVDG